MAWLGVGPALVLVAPGAGGGSPEEVGMLTHCGTPYSKVRVGWPPCAPLAQASSAAEQPKRMEAADVAAWHQPASSLYPAR